jgi:hypothetical protein
MKQISIAIETDPDKVIEMLEPYTTPAFEMRCGKFRGLSAAVRSAIVVIARQKEALARSKITS